MQACLNLISYINIFMDYNYISQLEGAKLFLTQFLCQVICTQRTPKGPK